MARLKADIVERMPYIIAVSFAAYDSAFDASRDRA